MPGTKEIGAAGERAALRYLRRRGFKPLEQNLRIGRLGELDIVMLHKGVLVFVEVKARLAAETIGGLDNITAAKQRQLVKLAGLYMKRQTGKHGAPKYKAVRFDAVEVVFADERLKRCEVKHLPDAFRP
ncbi:YraN family protein [bacterium]|nr:YraN family protein [bacterium]